MGQCKSIQRDLSFDLSQQVSQNQYTPVQTFRKGETGDVVLFMDRDGRQKVVGKVARRNHQENLVDLCLELEILSEISHRHNGIVNLRSALLTNRELVMFTEYVPGRNMREYIEQQPVSEDMSVYLLRQMMSILAFCHENNVSQRDFKMEAFICDESSPPHLHLCDLGMSKQWVKMVTESKTVQARSGIMTPQMLDNIFLEIETQYDGTKVDIWAVGVCLCSLLFGSSAQDELHRTSHSLSRCSWRTAASVKQQAGSVSLEAQDLLDKMLDPDDSSRISIQGIMSHPWYNRQLPGHLQSALDSMEADQATLTASFSPRQSVQESTLRLTALATSGRPVPNGSVRLNYPRA